MFTARSFGVATAVIVTIAAVVFAQDHPNSQIDKGHDMKNKSQALMSSLVGSWDGTCRTWFKPGELADESKIEGEFKLILGGQFLRHAYQGEIQGKPRHGEETIAFNTGSGKFEISWMDDFHMNYGILFSEGDPADNGFTVFGEYAVGPDQPSWGWKTVYELIDNDHLVITAYNVTPDGREAKAVETIYARKNRE